MAPTGSAIFGIPNPSKDGGEDDSTDGSSSEGDISEDYQTAVHNVPSPEPVETSLEVAINTAPMKEIREVLHELVRTQSAAKDLVVKRLTAPISGPGNKKRKAYETCINCNEEYQVTDNKHGGCIYHPGNMEADHDSEHWADVYEEWEQPTEEDYPEAFIWNCCSQRGNMEGCIVSRHTYVGETNRRVRPSAPFASNV